jgi:pimeloyl-ACP methyl ester carboxylesterase
VLAGHSIGGAIALTYALGHALDLKAIVLVSTGARLRVLPAILDGLRADHAGMVERIVTMCLAPAADPRVARRLTEAMLAVPAEVTRGDFQACDAFDVMARLEEIRIPALVIGGREDRMTPPKFAEYLHAHLPDSRLVWVEGAGHMVHAERSRQVNEAIRQFLSISACGDSRWGNIRRSLGPGCGAGGPCPCTRWRLGVSPPAHRRSGRAPRRWRI